LAIYSTFNTRFGPLTRRLVIAALLLISHTAYSAGLGDLKHQSYIGQPFNGTIELISTENLSADNIIVRQLFEQDAAAIGIETLPFPYQLQFEPITEQGQLRSISVSSTKNIYEPYVSIVVELTWPGGKVFREYAILMDTPPARAPAPERSLATNPAGDAVTDENTFSNNTQSFVAANDVDFGERYTVQPGDTLSGIVSRIDRPESIGKQQMVRAVYEANPSAFIDSNINQLIAGATLAVPSEPMVRNRETSSTPETARSLPSATTSAARDLNGSLANREGRLSLSDGGKPDKGADYDVPQIREEIDGTQEMIDMLVRENQDLRERIEQIENSEYLTTLSELVAMQRRQIEELKEEFRAQANAESNDASSFEQEGTSVSAPIPVVSAGADSASEELSLSQKLAQNFWSFISLLVVAFIAIIALCVYAVRKLANTKQEDADYSEYRERIESTVDLDSFVGINDSASIDATAQADNVTAIDAARRPNLSQRLNERDEYNSSPSISQIQSERHKVGVNLVMGLDEEVNELLSMAKIYCSAGKYSEARAILNAQNREGSDPRLIDALEQIDRLEQQQDEEDAQ